MDINKICSPSENEKKVWYEMFPLLIEHLSKLTAESGLFSEMKKEELPPHLFKKYTSVYCHNTKEPSTYLNELGQIFKGTMNQFEIEVFYQKKYKYSIRSIFNSFTDEKHEEWVEGGLFGMKKKQIIVPRKKVHYFDHIYITLPNEKIDWKLKSINGINDLLKSKNINLSEELNQYINFLKLIDDAIESFYKNQVTNEVDKRNTNFNQNKNNLLLELDKNEDGLVDLNEPELFYKILNNNQSSIAAIDKNYIHNFVKIYKYLKTKKENTQTIFEDIAKTKDSIEFKELAKLLRNQVYSYELLLLHSLNMLTSIIEGDFISFYEIYECFDKLNVFNSNWENEVTEKLSNIEKNIKEVMHAIYHMEYEIVSAINKLTYITQESFKDLVTKSDAQLKNINSSIKMGNILSGIQTYQMYKINQNPIN